jgi:ComF family protein
MFITERLVGSIAPHLCIICGSEGSLLCDWCLPDAMPPVPSRCYRCHSLTDNSSVCKKCRPKSRLGHVWVRTEYDGHAKRLIHDFKFERAQAAAAPVARLMAEPVPYLDRQVIVTHVPTATSRVRRRGYDHARLLAGQLAKNLDLAYAPLLMRLGQTRQVGSKRSSRLAQLQGAFTVRKSGPIQGGHILLVDDIVTTGATLELAARVLKAGGAKSIDAAVFAQKI